MVTARLKLLIASGAIFHYEFIIPAWNTRQLHQKHTSAVWCFFMPEDEIGGLE